MQRAAGLEAVGVGRDAAHGVHRHRPAEEAGMLARRACRSRAAAIEHRPLERDMADLGRDPRGSSRPGSPQRSATASGA